MHRRRNDLGEKWSFAAPHVHPLWSDGGAKGVKQCRPMGTYDTLLSPVMVAWHDHCRGIPSQGRDEPRLKLHKGLHEKRRHWGAGIE